MLEVWVSTSRSGEYDMYGGAYGPKVWLSLSDYSIAHD
jgi:hypothetical protein